MSGGASTDKGFHPRASTERTRDVDQTKPPVDRVACDSRVGSHVGVRVTRGAATGRDVDAETTADAHEGAKLAIVELV